MEFKTSIRNETAGRLPIRPAVCLSRRTLVRAAIARMKSQRLGVAVVVDSFSRPLGLFTERTVLDLLLNGVDIDLAVVEDHLERDWIAIQQDAAVDVLWRVVVDQGQRFVCVTDAGGHVVGITGQRGLAEYLAEHYPRQVFGQPVGVRHAASGREGA